MLVEREQKISSVRAVRTCISSESKPDLVSTGYPGPREAGAIEPVLPAPRLLAAPVRERDPGVERRPWFRFIVSCEATSLIRISQK